MLLTSSHFVTLEQWERRRSCKLPKQHWLVEAVALPVNSVRCVVAHKNSPSKCAFCAVENDHLNRASLPFWYVNSQDGQQEIRSVERG